MAVGGIGSSLYEPSAALLPLLGADLNFRCIIGI